MSALRKYFENLLEPQILAMLLIVLAACVILTMLLSQKAPDFKTKKSPFYIYVFSLAFVYSIIAFFGGIIANGMEQFFIEEQELKPSKSFIDKLLG